MRRMRDPIHDFTINNISAAPEHLRDPQTQPCGKPLAYNVRKFTFDVSQLFISIGKFYL